MDRGNFDPYQDDGQHQSSASSMQDNEIYQIYEELVGVVQDHYDQLEASEEDQLSRTTAADADAAGKGQERPKWNKNGRPGDNKNDGAGARALAEDDSESSDEIGRNPNASPISYPEKANKGRNGSSKKDGLPGRAAEPRREDPRFQPTMSAVVEETEPESSFKETDKQRK